MPYLVDDTGKPALSLRGGREMGQGDLEKRGGGDKWEEWREGSLWYRCIV